MNWTRINPDTIICGLWSIRRGGWLSGIAYRLTYGGRLIALCQSAENAMAMAEAVSV